MLRQKPTRSKFSLYGSSEHSQIIKRCVAFDIVAARTGHSDVLNRIANCVVDSIQRRTAGAMSLRVRTRNIRVVQRGAAVRARRRYFSKYLEQLIFEREPAVLSPIFSCGYQVSQSAFWLRQANSPPAGNIRCSIWMRGCISLTIFAHFFWIGPLPHLLVRESTFLTSRIAFEFLSVFLVVAANAFSSFAQISAAPLLVVFAIARPDSLRCQCRCAALFTDTAPHANRSFANRAHATTIVASFRRW